MTQKLVSLIMGQLIRFDRSGDSTNQILRSEIIGMVKALNTILPEGEKMYRVEFGSYEINGNGSELLNDGALDLTCYPL